MAAIGDLKKDAPAYAKAEQAEAAAAKKDYAGARSLINEAIRMEPREARFHGFLGELELADKDTKGALVEFNKAVELDPGYFKPLAQAGIANYQLGNKAAAESSLTRSMQLMPSVPGAYFLGRVYEDEGNTAEAAKLYKAVAQTNTAFGKDAAARLQKLSAGQGR
jgi:lipopolysaccharide biosynthesis regulator YciM